MNMNQWSDDDREEFEALCAESWESSHRQHERTDRFVAGLHDARQAHRPWADEVLREAERRGCASTLKNWSKRNQVAVTRDGRRISKPRVIGTRRQDSDGRTYTQQTLFDFMTLDELLAKRRENFVMIRSYGDSNAVLDKLIALCEVADEITPAAAAKKLNTTVEAWLDEVAS